MAQNDRSVFRAISEIVGNSVLILDQNPFKDFEKIKIKPATQMAVLKNQTLQQ